MNPYTIASKIRRLHTDLCNFNYKVFDKLEPELRIRIYAISDSIMELANNIEYQADKEFFGGDMSSRKNHEGLDALDYLEEDEDLTEEQDFIEYEMTDEEYEEYLWKEPKEGGQSEGDALMSNGVDT
jgi:hypothetical protein